MKHLFTLLLCSLFLHHAHTQTFPYTFSVEHGTYTPLTNAISVNNGQIWDDIEENVPLGFGFQFMGETTEILHWFGNTAYNIFGLPAVETPLLMSYGADLIDRGYNSDKSLSPISFKTEGEPGSRIFKMEWANAGFFGDDTGNDFVNTQLWIYEGSHDVEMHFGPTLSTSPTNFDYTGPLIGFISEYSFSTEDFQDFWYLSGPVDSPVLSHLSSEEGVDTLQQTLNGAPGNGLIYRFSTGVVAVGDPGQVDHGIQVYPSLVTDAFSIAVRDRNAGLRYTVFDALGKAVRSGQVNGDLERVEMSGLPAGLYYVNLFSAEGSFATKKIWKE